jgi:hypothetical protein
MPTVAEEVKAALAAERASERLASEERDRKLKRILDTKGLYLRQQAQAADEAFRRRIDRMHRDAEAREAALKRTAPERERLETQLRAIDVEQGERIAELDRERAVALASFEWRRGPVRAALAALAQGVELQAKQEKEPAKKGFLSRRGAK